MLGSVVIRSSTTKIAQAAMGEFTAAVNLFQEAEQLGGRATQFAVGCGNCFFENPTHRES